MRFLVSEKPYETPIASGRLRYEQDGERNGVVEIWRLTHTTHGDRILRVDYDARALNGQSYLYHLVMSADDQPERLVYRYLGDDGGMLSGNLLFTDGKVLNSRKMGEAHFEEEIAQRPILFPTAIGAGVAARALIGQRPNSAEVGILDMHGLQDNFLKLRSRSVRTLPQRTRDLKLVRIGSQTHRATTLQLSWAPDQTYKLWLDLKGKWPLKVDRGNNLIGHETQYIRYGKTLI